MSLKKSFRMASIAACFLATLALLGNAQGAVVVIDGMNVDATYKVFNPIFSRYLYDNIDSDWHSDIRKRDGVILPFIWNGDTFDTVETVNDLSKLLRQAYSNSLDKNKPLIVLAHSWGTVLAYLAIDANPDIVIDKLITLGSPLGSKTPIIRPYTRTYVKEVNSLSNIRSWHNYWAKCDPISGSIKVSHNMEESPNVPLCHSSYYEDYGIWQNILLDVLATTKNDQKRLYGKWDTKIYYNGRLAFTPEWTLNKDGTFEECEEGYSCDHGYWSITNNTININLGYVTFSGTVSYEEPSMRGKLNNLFYGEGNWSSKKKK